MFNTLVQPSEKFLEVIENTACSGKLQLEEIIKIFMITKWHVNIYIII